MAGETQPWRGADQYQPFRLGQLLVLLDVGRTISASRINLDRLAYYDFFAANPLLIFTEHGPERTELVLAGFDSRALSYQSSSQRFANRRSRLQHDLALLIAFGLARALNADRRLLHEITDDGAALAQRLASLYADAYRRSAALVIKRLRGLSDSHLDESARMWLRADTLLIDLYDREPPELSQVSRSGGETGVA
jgi:hypothetical protein